MTTQPTLLDDPNYNPNRLLDTLQSKLCLKNDAALSRALGVAPPVLSKIRHRRMPVAAGLMIQIHDATQLTIDEIRTLMGVATAHRWFRPAEQATDKAGSDVDAGREPYHG
ncbi:MAG TPA: hypothetical protein VEC06_15145 [Paucimonas sp.]|nr:hypothetical protein [Paucimonas sp.]